jgi:hypothetical protein
MMIVPCYKHDLVLWLSKHSVSATASTSFLRLLKCPPPLSVHTPDTLIVDCRTLSKVPGLFRHQKFVGEASLHFELELNALGFLNVPSGEYLMVKTLLGCALKTESLRTYVGMTCTVV